MKSCLYQSADTYDFSTCPYNANHKFQPHRYFQHIKKCKDGLKIRHQFQECEFNNLHVFRKERIMGHLEECPDRQASLKKKAALLKAYHQNQLKLKMKKQEQMKTEENQVPEEKEKDQCFCILENCEECHRILEAIQPILMMVSKKKRDKLRDLLEKYRSLWRREHRQMKLEQETSIEFPQF